MKTPSLFSLPEPILNLIFWKTSRTSLYQLIQIKKEMLSTLSSDISSMDEFSKVIPRIESLFLLTQLQPERQDDFIEAYYNFHIKDEESSFYKDFESFKQNILKLLKKEKTERRKYTDLVPPTLRS